MLEIFFLLGFISGISIMYALAIGYMIFLAYGMLQNIPCRKIIDMLQFSETAGSCVSSGRYGDCRYKVTIPVD